MLKHVLNAMLARLGYELRPNRPPQDYGEPDPEIRALYRPLYSPWLGKGEFHHYYEIAAPRTLVSAGSQFVLYTMLRQALRLEGNVWECGVYKGGTAAMMAALIEAQGSDKRLYLFDTFEGMPATDAKRDWHKQGDFADTSLEAAAGYIGHGGMCVYRKGYIPDTFAGLESERIAFAHIDVDVYKSIMDCLAFIWPRLSVGGMIVLDDYGLPSCPGARTAVDEFFRREACRPLCLQTGQALVFKSMA